jgi:hypothetical protein
MQKLSSVGKFHVEPPFTSFDDLVGAGEQRRRHRDSQRSLAEATQKLGVQLGRSAAEKPDHRQRRLLRARPERPRRRAAEQRDEFAAFCFLL